MKIASVSFPAVSGKPTREEYRGTVIYEDDLNTVTMNRFEIFFDYAVERQKITNVGGIPEGSYWLDICEWSSAWGSSFRHQSFSRHWLDTPGWGIFSGRLHKERGTETYERSGFHIHGGYQWGSAGCIDVKDSDVTLDGFFEKAYKEGGCKCCYVPVTVAYKHNKVSVFEERPDAVWK